MANRNQKNKKGNYHRPNFWGMMRDVLIHSLNKGQFLIGLIGFCIIIMILKMSQERTEEFIFELLSMVKSIYYVGWTLTFICILGWYSSSRRLRKIHTSEMRRISQEKKSIQENSLGIKLATSDVKNN